MLFSKTQEYAIQALIHLALSPAAFHLNRDVAEQLNVPGPYLAKVLKRFAQEGYLDSAKGRGGGYRIRKRALDASVRDVIALADGRDLFEGCPLGHSRCNDRVACALHEHWTPLRDTLAGLFENATVGDLAARSAGAAKTKAKGRARSVTPVSTAKTKKSATTR